MEDAWLRRNLAKNIKSLLAKRGWSLTVLADFAGVSRAQMYKIVGEQHAASIDWLQKVSKALEVDPWNLLKPPN